MNPLLSIVVPTKNRYYTLEFLIKLLVSYKDKDIEIVIQDNSDDNSRFLSFINYVQTSESNLKYYYNSEFIPVGANVDRAVNNSTGDYICVLGDDDAVTHSIMKCVKYMKANKVDSMVFPAVYYVWPGVQSQYSRVDYSRGLLSIPHTNGEVREIDHQKEFENCMAKGARSLEYMPNAYHGIVSRSILSQIFNKTGSYFPGPSPDMANAIALCFFVKKHAYYDVPVMVHGHCLNSAGGLGRAGKHVEKNLSKLPFLGENINKIWDKTIPKIWTGETIYAISAFEALNRIGEKYLKEKFNYREFYTNFLKRHPSLLVDLLLIKDKSFLVKFSTIISLLSTIPYFIFLLTPNRIKKVYRKINYKKYIDPNLKIELTAENIIQCINKIENN
jgi:glycosyltransferase involved in cell wall biosynthesis